jgi:hypothetical protein
MGELGGEIRETLGITQGCPVLEDVIAPVFVAVLMHADEKASHGRTEHPLRFGPDSDKADARNVRLRRRNVAK